MLASEISRAGNPVMLRKLTYFNVRGRAESIRLLLEEAGVEYTDNRVQVEQWPALKETLPMGQLPVYEEGEGDSALHLFHSGVIRRYLGISLDMAGGNERERLACEMVAESIVDAQNSIGTLMWNPEFTSLRDAYEQETLPVILDRLQKHKARDTNSDLFWVGSSVSYADFIAWSYLDYVRALSTDTLKRFDDLYRFYVNLAERPRIAAYLASDRRPPTLTVSMAAFGGTPETS